MRVEIRMRRPQATAHTVSQVCGRSSSARTKRWGAGVVLKWPNVLKGDGSAGCEYNCSGASDGGRDVAMADCFARKSRAVGNTMSETRRANNVRALIQCCGRLLIGLLRRLARATLSTSPAMSWEHGRSDGMIRACDGRGGRLTRVACRRAD